MSRRGDRGPADRTARADGVPGEGAQGEVAWLTVVNDELRHRIANLAAITRALVNQTLTDGVSIDAARATLDRRLAAVERATTLLRRRDWQGASLRATVDAALAAFGAADDHWCCEGPAIEITGGAAMMLTLALHELGTNAAKYGAWSTADGSVALDWKIVALDGADNLWLQWAEHGGPAVVPPTREGAGTRLLTIAPERALGATVEHVHAPSGTTWLLVVPLTRIAG